jgi:hypothetical protein
MAATPLQILLEDAFVNIVVGSTPTTGPFDFDFPFFSEVDDIKVARTDDVTGVVTDLAVTTDFTVSGTSVEGGFQGGTITLVASDSDATLLIYRDIGVKRIDWFPVSGPFDITTLNQTFARIFAIAQEINESIDRGLKLPIIEAGTVMVIPELADRTNKFLAFDGSGAAIAATAVTGTVVSTFMETVLDDLTSAAALTTLGMNSARAQALGSASILNTGVASGDLPLLGTDGALPAVIGAFPRATSIKTGAYSVVAGDQGVLFVGDTSGGAFTITLPLLSGVSNGYTVGFKCDGANALTVDGNGSETIDGSASLVLADDDILSVTKANGEWKIVSSTQSGRVLQVVQTQDGAVATGTTTMAEDDTIPQNTEGDEYMTLAITPKNAGSRIRVDVTAWSTFSTAAPQVCALFVDSTADALMAVVNQGNPTGGARNNHNFSYDVASSSTTARTYKVRLGGVSGGTLTFNGVSSGRLLGGVMGSSIIITEYMP